MCVYGHAYVYVYNFVCDAYHVLLCVTHSMCVCVVVNFFGESGISTCEHISMHTCVCVCLSVCACVDGASEPEL